MTATLSINREHFEAARRFVLDTVLDKHRDYARAVLMEKVGAMKIQGHWSSGNPYYAKPWNEHYGIGVKIAEEIDFDIGRLVDSGKCWGYYERFLAKQKRAIEKRKATIARRGGFRAPRDSQRSRLYAAENAAFGKGEAGLGGKRLETVKEMQAYVDKLASSAWYQRRRWAKRFEVQPGHGHRRATSTGRVLQMPKWARVEWVLLHEMSHTIANARWGYSNIQSHGWQFCSVYLELVHHRLGKAAADALKREMRARNVRFTEPKKRHMTEEQKQVLRDRLAKARAAKAHSKEAA